MTDDAPEVAAFLASVEPARRREDAAALDRLFRETTEWTPRLWPGGIVGYGAYRYRYASGRAGTSLATGFAPRKTSLVVYIMPGYADFGPLLDRLGPHRTGKACLYVKSLADVDTGVLAEIVRAGLQDLASRHEVSP
jgi:hypothetical protein